MEVVDDGNSGLVYMHTNQITGLSYVGQTIKTMDFRFRCHCLEAKREGNTGSHFHRALNKYGDTCWDSTILEEGIEISELDDKERFYIEKYNTYYEGYNMTVGGVSGRGCSPSKETRIKLSEAGKGREVSEETKKKISGSNKGNRNRLGHTNSDDHRKKISESRKGCNNPGFKPWAITKPDGTYETYHNITKTQYAIDNGLPIKAFCCRFGKVQAGKVAKTGAFKGWIMENIND